MFNNKKIVKSKTHSCKKIKILILLNLLKSYLNLSVSRNELVSSKILKITNTIVNKCIQLL